MGCFKPSVIFTSDPAAPELADTTTRRRLRLTATEGRVLTEYDGSQTAKELALWAANEGLAIGPLQLQVMLERLERAGFVLHAPHVPAQDVRDVGFAPTDDPLTLAHIVPSMRNDLRIVLSAGSRSTFQVSDPLAHRSFTLYDFEVSIARMLDGRRHAGEVIEASAKIGIPVTLESLRRFLLQLKAYKFLSAEPADLAKRGIHSTWPMRAEWTEDLRTLFRSALRLLRAGRLPESREFVLAMLEIDPMNKEGQETKARVEDLQRDPVVELTFADLHGEPASSTGALLDSQKRVAVALPPEEPVLPAPALAPEPEPAPAIAAPPPAPVAPPPAPPIIEAPPPIVEGKAEPPMLLPTEVKAPDEAEAKPADELLPISSAIEMVPVASAVESLPVLPELEPSPVSSEPEPVAPDLSLPLASVDDVVVEPEVKLPVSSEVEESPGPSSALSPKGAGGRWRRVVIVVLLAGVAALLAVPLPRTKVVPCELSPVQVATVIVPRSGTIEELPVTEGQLVEKGQLLGTMSTKGTAAELERLRTKAAALEQQLDQLAKSVRPAEVEKARAALAAKTKELAQVTEQKRRLEAKHSPAAAIAHVEKELRAKQALVDKATEQLAQVSQEEKLGNGRRVLEGLKRQSAQLQTEVAEARIVAPEAGRLEGLATAGALLAEHAEFAHLVAPAALAVVAHNPGMSTSLDPSGASVSLGAGPPLPVADIHWVKDVAEPRLTGTIASAGLKPGPATLKVPAGKRSWGLELYERAQSMLR